VSMLPVNAPSAATEAALLDAARAGDVAAQRSLVRAHQEPVYRLLTKLSGDSELARDLAQETFIRALGALGTFRVGASLKPWLFKIANNLFLDYVRTRKPESLEALFESGFEVGCADPAIERAALALDLETALARLPVNWRQALVLRHQEDLPYEEIAEILGVPLGTAKTWLFRGRDRLRLLLGD
jgi:RNA polymerase sigma-70 factor (ECF subfamily)